jgi:outer membrane protein TolC
VEVLRAEAGVAARLESVITAEEALRQQQRRLKRLLNQPGMGLETATTLVPSTEAAPRAYELDRQELLQAAIESRMELLEVELQIAEQVSTIDFEKNRALPLLALDYEYTLNGLGADTSSAWDMVWDHGFSDHRIGLQVEVPLGNKAAQHRLRRAVLRKRQHLATRQQREALIQEEVLYAADRLETGWQRVLAGRQRTVLAAREMEAEERQFELGLRTSIDVLETQERFADAQRAEVQALADYQIALVDLAQSTGTVLGAARVRWQRLGERTAASQKGID